MPSSKKKTPGVPCFQRYDPSTKSIGDKRNQRYHLEDVEGIGKAALVRVHIDKYSDADGGYDTDCQRELVGGTGTVIVRGDRRTHCQDKHHDRHSPQFSTFITAYDPSSPDDDAIRQDILVFFTLAVNVRSEIVPPTLTGTNALNRVSSAPIGLLVPAESERP